MSFCKYCGQPLSGQNFCPSCGAKNEDAAAFQQAQNAQAQNAQGQNAAPQAAPPVIGGYDPADIEKTKVICGISYFSILFFLPLVAYPGSRFGKFHANQALILLIATAILNTATSVFTSFWGAFPLIPEVLKALLIGVVGAAGWALPLAASICGLVNALNGKAKELPLIGKFNLINK